MKQLRVRRIEERKCPCGATATHAISYYDNSQLILDNNGRPAPGSFKYSCDVHVSKVATEVLNGFGLAAVQQSGWDSKPLQEWDNSSEGVVVPDTESK